MSSEWRHVFARFRDFIRALRPSPEELNRAAAAAVETALCLRRRFRPAAGPSLDYLLIGGHGKGTAIRPATTVDLLYELPAELRRDDGSHGPLVLLDVAAALGERFSSVEPARGWLTVAPAGSGIVVRVIPAFPCPAGGYLVVEPGAPGPNAGHWRQINPAAESAALHLADKASADKATHLILMMKAWRATRTIPISALAFELLVAEFVSVWTYQRRSLLFYDWMVRDFFFWMRHQVGRQMPIPGTVDSVALGSLWLAEAEAAYLASTTACLLERDNRNGEALAIWRRIFGPAFAADPAQSPDAEPRRLAGPAKDVSSAA